MKALIVGFFALALALTCALKASAEAPRFCEGCNYAEAALANSDFTGAVLIGTNFANAVLTGSSFRNARLIAANFSGADLRGAHFDAANCIACNFGEALLDGATFSNVQMVAANFKNFSSAVENSQLRQLLSGCISCNFQGGHLGGRDLSGLALISVDLAFADLRGTNFAGAALCWYVANGALRKPQCDGMQGALIAGANFQNVQLCENPLARQGCTPAPQEMLRQYTAPKPTMTPGP